MKKKMFGRKLGRNVSQRTALFKGLMSSLVLHGQIKTTEAKAKSIKGEVDKLVTKARKDATLARKLLSPHLTSEALDKFLLEIAPKLKERNGGYTKTLRLGQRFADNSQMILMRWTDEIVIAKPEVKKIETTKKLEAPKKSVRQAQDKKEEKPKRAPRKRTVAKKEVKK